MSQKQFLIISNYGDAKVGRGVLTASRRNGSDG